jgi:cell division protein FtsQ
MTGRQPAAAGTTRQAPAEAGQAGSPGQPRSAWKAIFFLLAIIGIIVGVAWALLGSRFLVVRSVQVTGTSKLVPRSEVLAAAGIPLGLPLIRVDSDAVARRVERIRQVQSAQVSRGWPDGVTITVVQRTPLFTVPAGGRYDLVDAFGVVVTKAARHPARMPWLQVGNPPASPSSLRGSPAVRAAASVLREVPRPIARRVTTVATSSQAGVTLRLTGGISVVWGDASRGAQKSRELRLLMRTHALRYDVSGPGTAMTQG